MTVVVFKTTPAATFQVAALVSLYSIVYAVMGILSSVSGGSQAKTTEVAVMAVMHGFDGEPGFASPKMHSQKDERGGNDTSKANY